MSTTKSTTGAPGTLDERIERAGGPVQMLRNAPVGAYPFPIRAEFTNWRDEQRAWRTTATLMDSSFHMTDFYFKGPDVRRLLSDTGLNSFSNLGKDRAKQFVACNHEGYVIADCILMPSADDEVALIGRPATPHWVAYQAEKGGYDVEVTRDYQSSMNPGRRQLFRFQVQGPQSLMVVEKAAGHPLADIPLVGSAADTLLPNASLTNAAGDVAGSVWKSAAPDVYRLALGFLAGGLVLGGLYLAAKPAVHSVAGKVSDAAGNVGKLAALA